MTYLGTSKGNFTHCRLGAHCSTTWWADRYRLSLLWQNAFPVWQMFRENTLKASPHLHNMINKEIISQVAPSVQSNLIACLFCASFSVASMRKFFDHQTLTNWCKLSKVCWQWDQERHEYVWHSPGSFTPFEDLSNNCSLKDTWNHVHIRTL